MENLETTQLAGQTSFEREMETVEDRRMYARARHAVCGTKAVKEAPGVAAQKATPSVIAFDKELFAYKDDLGGLNPPFQATRTCGKVQEPVKVGKRTPAGRYPVDREDGGRIGVLLACEVRELVTRGSVRVGAATYWRG